MQVTLDVTFPLHHLLLVEYDGKERKLYLRYEKLVYFCYAYGRLNHVEKHCFATLAESETRQFGDSLRSSSTITRPLRERGVFTRWSVPVAGDEQVS